MVLLSYIPDPESIVSEILYEPILTRLIHHSDELIVYRQPIRRMGWVNPAVSSLTVNIQRVNSNIEP